MEGLRIREEDEEDLEFGDGVEEGEAAAVEQSLCLVGRFLTDRNIRVPTMKDRMADVWRPGRGIQIDEVEEGLFAFQFYHQLDIQKVLQLGPWSFDKHMLVLGVLQQGMQPQDVPLNHVPFWVQVHGVPTGFMSEMVGKSLANFIGEFLEYDPKNSASFWRPYMRIRVLVDVREPLKRSKRIKKQGGEAKTVTFKYERLETFCYLCGRMGHADVGCEIRFTMGVDNGERGWGPELRVENRRAGGGGSRSKWLRDGNDKEWVSPALIAAKKYGSNEGINSAVTQQKEGENSKNDAEGSGAVNGSKSGDKAIDGSNNYTNVADFFKDPKRFFPVKTVVPNSENVAQGKITDDDMSDVETIGVDRKKRQRGADNNTGGNVNSNMEDDVSEAVGEVTCSNNDPKNFLKVGPGNQAYQDK